MTPLSNNPAFHAKIGWFVLVGLVSIWPTIVFIRWRKSATSDSRFRIDAAEWRKARRLLIVELLVAFLPLAAVIMARGIGYQG
jgi:putative membrane protein